MPRICVVIPVYNTERYLGRCLDSVLAQTFTDLNIILVDDGSTDNSPFICDEYSKRDSRIHVIHKKNGGLSSARNTGIEWAINKGSDEWICFIDSDDWVNGVYLEGLLMSAVAGDCLISCCEFVRTNHIEGKFPEPGCNDYVIGTEDLYNNHFYIAQSAACKLYSLGLFADGCNRFKEGILYEDSALIYRILFSQSKLAFTDRSIYFYFQNTESITNSSWNPEKMIYFEVMGEQLNWLIGHSYKSCVKTCLLHFLSSIHYQESLIHKNQEYSSYAKEMRKICRILLRKYSKEYDVSFWKYPQLYETGYPILMNLFWFARAQIEKVKKR